MSPIELFYASTVSEFIHDTDASILVCGAGKADSSVFRSLPFKNVTMSGMDLRREVHSEFEPNRENAESLSYDDNSFDYVIIHAAIHHTRLPHKVITELYRVARNGFLAIESRDSFLIRITERLGLTESYEVSGNHVGSGVNGTDIPNYIYRWTEREIEKTINTYDPCYLHKFYYKYGTVYPDGKQLSTPKRLVIGLGRPIHQVISKIFPRQQNHFAFFVEKPQGSKRLHPWLSENADNGAIEVNREWIWSRYRK